MIAISTPTGKVGSKVLALFENRPDRLTVLAREPRRLPKWVQERATIMQGNQDDANFVRRATQGTNMLLWITPPNMRAADVLGWYSLLADVVFGAVRSNGIERVVNLSSLGAQMVNGMGPVSGLHRVETALNTASSNVTHLRACWFMENQLMQLESILEEGVVRSLAPGNRRGPMIATRDIAAVAFKFLRDDSWIGQNIQGLHGAGDISYDEIAGVFTQSLGRPVRHVQTSPDDMTRALEQKGMSAAVAHGLVELGLRFGDPSVISEPRTNQTTTPTTFKQWVDEEMVHKAHASMDAEQPANVK